MSLAPSRRRTAARLSAFAGLLALPLLAGCYAQDPYYADSGYGYPNYGYGYPAYGYGYGYYGYGYGCGWDCDDWRHHHHHDDDGDGHHHGGGDPGGGSGGGGGGGGGNVMNDPRLRYLGSGQYGRDQRENGGLPGHAQNRTVPDTGHSSPGFVCPPTGCRPRS
jgi:hypothetical protein